MGPTRAGKHGGRCVGPIPGSSRLHFTVLSGWAQRGSFGSAPRENVARNSCCRCGELVVAQISPWASPGHIRITFSPVAFSVRTIEADRHREFNASQPSVSFLQTPAWGQVKSEWRSESVGWFNGTDDPVGAGLVLPFAALAPIAYIAGRLVLA